MLLAAAAILLFAFLIFEQSTEMKETGEVELALARNSEDVALLKIIFCASSAIWNISNTPLRPLYPVILHLLHPAPRVSVLPLIESTEH